MAVLGIAGTAKNTGKTTTTVALLEQVYHRNLAVAITSIGLDGETLDQVTGLPKPRLPLRKGTLLAVAEGCLKGKENLVEILESLPIHTPLGAVLVSRMKEDGLVMVAGPNKSHELRQVLACLKRYGAHWIFVDGALNRLAPMAEADGLILATGAARTPELDQLAAETQAITQIFSLPMKQVPGGERILIGRGESILQEGPEAPLLLEKDALHWQREVEQIDGEWVYFPGLITAGVWRAWQTKKFLVARDSTKILLGGDPLEVGKGLRELAERGGRVGVIRPLPLLAITANPFFPRFDPGSQTYFPDQVSGERLLRLLKDRLPTPVFDVVSQGSVGLWEIIGKEDFPH